MGYCTQGKLLIAMKSVVVLAHFILSVRTNSLHQGRWTNFGTILMLLRKWCQNHYQLPNDHDMSVLNQTCGLKYAVKTNHGIQSIHVKTKPSFVNFFALDVLVFLWPVGFVAVNKVTSLFDHNYIVCCNLFITMTIIYNLNSI